VCQRHRRNVRHTERRAQHCRRFARIRQRLDCVRRCVASCAWRPGARRVACNAGARERQFHQNRTIRIVLRIAQWKSIGVMLVDHGQRVAMLIEKQVCQDYLSHIYPPSYAINNRHQSVATIDGHTSSFDSHRTALCIGLAIHPIGIDQRNVAVEIMLNHSRTTGGRQSRLSKPCHR
jgi:hypothetical protein